MPMEFHALILFVCVCVCDILVAYMAVDIAWYFGMFVVM